MNNIIKFLFLGCFISAASVQAFDSIEDNLELKDALGKKRVHAEEGQGSKRLKKSTDHELKADAHEEKSEETINKCGPAFIVYLDKQSKNEMAHVNRAMLQCVLADRMQNDPRQLQFNPWVEGPALDSLELYRLNAAVFHAIKKSIILRLNFGVSEKNCLEHIQLGIPISDVNRFIRANFPQTLKARERIVKVFDEIVECLIWKNPFNLSLDLKALGADKKNKSEHELMRFVYYVVQGQYSDHAEEWAYADLEENPDRMSLVKRAHMTQQGLSRVNYHHTRTDYVADKDEREQIWDFIFRYSPFNIPLDTLRSLAETEFESDCYSLSSKLYNQILTRAGANVLSEDLDGAIWSNHYTLRFKELSDNQVVENYDRVLTVMPKFWTYSLIDYDLQKADRKDKSDALFADLQAKRPQHELIEAYRLGLKHIRDFNADLETSHLRDRLRSLGIEGAEVEPSEEEE